MLLLHGASAIVDLFAENLNSDFIGQSDLVCQKSLMPSDVLIGLLSSMEVFVIRGLKQNALF